MPDVVIERELSAESQLIINALQTVNCGQDVFDALIEVPTPNLIEMSEMIAHILKHRICNTD